MTIQIIKNKSNLPDNEMERIMAEYELKLEIPKEKLERQIMICPVGIIGAGKTTVIKPLSKKLNLLCISIDGIRELLKENNYDYERAKEIVVRLAEKYIKKNFSIGLNTDCVSEESQRYIRQFKDKYNVKVFWIHINPPEEFIINKLRNYKHTWLFKNAEHAVGAYKRRKAAHKNLNFPFIYTFDPSRDDLENQIDEVISIIKKK